MVDRSIYPNSTQNITKKSGLFQKFWNSSAHFSEWTGVKRALKIAEGTPPKKERTGGLIINIKKPT